MAAASDALFTTRWSVNQRNKATVGVGEVKVLMDCMNKDSSLMLSQSNARDSRFPFKGKSYGQYVTGKRL